MKATANFSPKEKQDALRQKNLPVAGAGIQAQSCADGDIRNSGADDTTKSYQQKHGEQFTGNRQPKQYQHQGQQQIQRPFAYHENTIKTKGTVLHRKSDVPFSIKRADDFSLIERKGKKSTETETGSNIQST